MALILALLVCLVAFAHALKFSSGLFFSGIDQGHYLDAARAWSVWDLSQAKHHYLAGYPLLAVPFLWLTPWQPFLVPDLLCLLASLLIFVRIGRRLAPGWRDWVFAVCFLAAAASGRWVFVWTWVIPWTSTGAAPLQFLSVLFALRFWEKPAPSRAFALGLAIALVMGFRPSDASVLLASCGGFALAALVRDRPRPRAWMGMAGAGACGLVVGVLPWVLTHALVFGSAPGAYVSKSTGIGLEWRLLPMRWVTLVIDPRPLLPEGAGLAEVLPWVITGVAGMILALLPRPGHRIAPAALVAATLVLHWALYLSFRDLQPYGLWRFANIHYFKWTFPFLVLWTAQFAVAFCTRPDRLRAGVAAVITLSLFAWRPELQDGGQVAIAAEDHAISLPAGLAPLDRALLLPLSGSWRALYFGDFRLHAGDREFANTRDFKVLPVPRGALLLPLRPLPVGPATLDMPADVSLDASGQARRFTQVIVPGLPCAFFRKRPDCAVWK